MNSQLKREILEYVKKSYEEKSRVPSVKEILERFKGLNRASFYRVFPGGVGEMCELNGLPVPRERLERMAIAIKGKMSKKGLTLSLTLTEGQTKRLLAISHLEGGKDPLLIIDRLLHADAVLRREYKLSINDIARLALFLQYAVAIGWRIHGDPDLLDCLTRAWNLGFLSLQPEAMRYLVQVLEDARARGWKPSEFADYVTKFYNGIQAYCMYEKRLMSLEDFKRVIESHV